MMSALKSKDFMISFSHILTIRAELIIAAPSVVDLHQLENACVIITYTSCSLTFILRSQNLLTLSMTCKKDHKTSPTLEGRRCYISTIHAFHYPKRSRSVSMVQVRASLDLVFIHADNSRRASHCCSFLSS